MFKKSLILIILLLIPNMISNAEEYDNYMTDRYDEPWNESSEFAYPQYQYENNTRQPWSNPYEQQRPQQGWTNQSTQTVNNQQQQDKSFSYQYDENKPKLRSEDTYRTTPQTPNQQNSWSNPYEQTQRPQQYQSNPYRQETRQQSNTYEQNQTVQQERQAYPSYRYGQNAQQTNQEYSYYQQEQSNQQQWSNPYEQQRSQQQWGNPYEQETQQWQNPYEQEDQQQWSNPYEQQRTQDSWSNPYEQQKPQQETTNSSSQYRQEQDNKQPYSQQYSPYSNYQNENQGYGESPEFVYPNPNGSSKEVTVAEPKTSEDYVKIYNELEPANFSYMHDMDPDQYYDIKDTTWAPYPLLRLNSYIYFKNQAIEPGYYLITPREYKGKWYMLFKQNGKVAHIIPVYQRDFVPETFYETHLAKPKLTPSQKIHMGFLSFLGKFDSSKRRDPVKSYLEINDLENYFVSIIIYYGPRKYSTIFRTIKL